MGEGFWHLLCEFDQKLIATGKLARQACLARRAKTRRAKLQKYHISAVW
jgi:hypothetical protein